MYNQYEEVLAAHFERATKEYDLKYRDTKDSKAQELFDEYIKSFQGASIPGITKDNFRVIGQPQMFNYTFHHLSRLLPRHFTNTTIRELYDKTYLSNGEDPIDGIILTITDTRDNSTETVIQIPLLDRTSAIACSGHEYPHALLRKTGLKSIKDFHHNEIISILMEMIISDIVDADKIENQMLDKTSLLRLDGIIHHSQTYELASNINNMTEIEKQLLCRFNPVELKKLKTNLNYEMHNSYTYLVSYPYALHLFEEYKNNPHEVLSNLDKVFSAEMTVEDLLTAYDMRLSKREISEKPFKELTRVKKIELK